MLQDPRMVKTSDIKEDQDKEKAEATSTTAMDTEMPELILDDEQPSHKQFTFKKPTGPRPVGK